MSKKILISILAIILAFSISLSGCKKPEEPLKTEEQIEKPLEETIVEEEKEVIEKPTEEIIEEKKPIAGEVSFKTEDNIVISGNIFGSGDKWVILSHMYPTDQKSWFSFAEYLAKNGYISLTYDFRGYGNSGGSQEISQIYKDLEAALKFINQYEIKKIFLIGASMGGTASIIVSSKEGGEKISGLVTISAPAEFKGLSAINEIEKAACPKLFIASRGDEPAAQNANIFFEKSSEPKSIEILDGKAHGTFIFEEEPQNAEKLKQLILDFLNNN